MKPLPPSEDNGLVVGACLVLIALPLAWLLMRGF